MLCALPGLLRTSSAMGRYTPQTPCAPRAAKHPLRVCSAPRSLKYPRRKEVPPIDFCHIPVSIIKRSEGRSAVAAAAYRSGTKLTNEWDGMTHHSATDIADMASIPGMRVYLPSDRFQTRKLMEALYQDDQTAYIRVGRYAVPDVYSEDNCPFEMDKATVIGEGTDVAIIACGEMVEAAVAASKELNEQGISAGVLDMYCVKPLDEQAVIRAAEKAKAVIVIEEHTRIGGLGSMVCQIVAANAPRKVTCMGLPDAPVITGNSREVFDYYHLNKDGIIAAAKELLK